MIDGWTCWCRISGAHLTLKVAQCLTRVVNAQSEQDNNVTKHSKHNIKTVSRYKNKCIKKNKKQEGKGRHLAAATNSVDFFFPRFLFHSAAEKSAPSAAGIWRDARRDAGVTSRAASRLFVCCGSRRLTVRSVRPIVFVCFFFE